MEMSRVPFPYGEAQRMTGRRVRLAHAHYRWPAGTGGIVVATHPYRAGSVVEVQFDTDSTQLHAGFDYFSKDEFLRLLEEC